MGFAVKTKGPKMIYKADPLRINTLCVGYPPAKYINVTSTIENQAVFVTTKLVFICVQICENLIKKDNHAVLAVMQNESCDCAKSLHKDLDNVNHQLVGEFGRALSVYAGIALAGFCP